MAKISNRRGLIGRLSKHSERLTLSQKLTAIGVVSSTVSLIVAAALLLAIDLAYARHRLVRDTTLLADVIGVNSVNAIVDRDRSAASEVLLASAANRRRAGRQRCRPETAFCCRPWNDGMARSRGDSPKTPHPRSVSDSGGEPAYRFTLSSLRISRPIDARRRDRRHGHDRVEPVESVLAGRWGRPAS